jgi:hypothetical protein
MEEFFEQVFYYFGFRFSLNEFVLLQGKPNDVLPSAERLLSSSNQSSQASVATTHKSSVEIEEQVIQTENALQTDAEQRCTGKTKKL